MRPTLTVYTAIIGTDTDSLKDPEPCALTVPFICFTDRDDLQSDTWRIVRVEREHISAAMDSRRIKILGDALADHTDATLWLDASFQLCVDPMQIADRWLWRYDMLALRHPDRDNIVDEAKEVARLGMAPRANVLRQLRQYEREGFVQQQTTITSTGLCLRRQSRSVHRFNVLWWKELQRWEHSRDQMSIDYAAWKRPIDIAHLEGHYRDNPYARWYKR